MPETEQPDYPGAPSGQENRPSDRFCLTVWHRFWRWIRGLGVIEVFTGLLAISTTVQVWAFVQSERASIAPVAVGLLPVTITAGPLVVGVQLKNSGKDTALIQENYLEFKIAEYLPTFPLYGTNPHQSRVILLPDAVLSTGGAARTNNIPAIIRAGEVDSINSGNTHLWVYGKIVYRDRYSFVFGSQVIGYCFEYIPANDPRAGMFNGCDAENYVYAY